MKIVNATLLLVLLLVSGGCHTISVPQAFTYREIETSTFRLASWQKITNPQAPYKIYIEGDGAAFRTSGRVSSNPTPRGTLLREIAFGDLHENVIYLARPCQFVKDEKCRPQYWSTARFAPEVIQANYEALRKIAEQNPLILVGFSGGAQVAGLVAVKYPELQITKLVTIAGNLDVATWVQHHQLKPLDLSEDLGAYRREYAHFPQVHYVGAQDGNIIPQITKDFVGKEQNVITIEEASHNQGWEAAYQRIRSE